MATVSIPSARARSAPAAKHLRAVPTPAPEAEAEAPTREQLLITHHEMVRAIAIRLAQRLPGHVEVEELVNIGFLGLIDALERYDASRGVPFRAFAELRVRGAMMDALRASDWTPRAVRRAGARIDAARTRLAAKTGRDPRREELAAELGVSPDAYDRLRTSSLVRRVSSLDAPASDDGDETPLSERVAGEGVSVLDRWLDAERDAWLAGAIAALPERERTVIVSYYERGMSLRQIGERLGVTESRICQIHGQALKKLRAAVAGEVA